MFCYFQFPDEMQPLNGVQVTHVQEKLKITVLSYGDKDKPFGFLFAFEKVGCFFG